MRNLLLVAGLAGVVATAACGDTDRNPVADGGSGGGSGKTGKAPAAGKSGTSEGGAGGSGEAVVDPLAPVVTITAPVDVESPDDGVLSGSEIEVVCTAKQSAEADAEEVDRASIKLQLLDAAGELVEEKPGTPTSEPDEYSNTFIVTDYPAGVIGFRCTAKDGGGTHTGEDENSNFLDKGPIVSFVSPEPESAHALAETFVIHFTVEPGLLSEDDDGAAVDVVTLEAGGVAIDLAGTEEAPGEYRKELDLRDASLFTPAPNGSFPVTVKATNSRSPGPVTAVVTQNSAIDGAGPTLKITSPADEAVVGGKVPLTFEVSDAVSGVHPESIVVTLNDVQHRYSDTDPDWGRPSANTFVFEFDTLNSLVVGDAKVQITVGIDAKDNVGNAADVKASALLYLDNFPPSVDLDPLNVRAVNDEGECGISFDPLGIAVDDTEAIATAGTFRAVVWENTNEVQGVPVKYHAGTNPARVRLYLKPNGGLLVNNDLDAECDDVADVDSTDSIALDAVPAAGTIWWNNGDPADTILPTPASLGCTTKAFDDADLISCGPSVKSDLWQVIKHWDGENVVYGTQVVGATCTGSGWEFGTKVASDGWVCFAARAVDFTENVGVSRPLRVCVDDPEVPGEPACKTGAPPPSCTDGCTPAPRWGGIAVDGG